jgi:hypothetical protein
LAMVHSSASGLTVGLKARAYRIWCPIWYPLSHEILKMTNHGPGAQRWTRDINEAPVEYDHLWGDQLEVVFLQPETKDAFI